jgi:hypothetical protein
MVEVLMSSSVPGGRRVMRDLTDEPEEVAAAEPLRGFAPYGSWGGTCKLIDDRCLGASVRAVSGVSVG